MNILVVSIVVIVVLSVALYMWGDSSAKRKTAEKGEADAIKKNKKHNEITSKPFVDNPFSKLRNDKK